MNDSQMVTYRRHLLQFYFAWTGGQGLNREVADEATRKEQELGIPGSLLVALYMVESTLKPPFVRRVENVLMRINLACATLLPFALHDFSVGPLQVRLSTAARVMDLTLGSQRNDRWLRLPKGREARRRTTAVLRRLPEIETNVAAAALYVSELAAQYQGHATIDQRRLASNFVRYVGECYSGIGPQPRTILLQDSAYPAILLHLTRLLRRNSGDRRADPGAISS